MRLDTLLELRDKYHVIGGVKMAAIQHIETFTPAEAAILTGVGVVNQRDHRRHFSEWFPKGPGHARFNLFQLLQMSFVTNAAEFGIGPGTAYETGEWVAHSALQFALSQPECISGDLAQECTIPDATELEIREYTARRVFSEGFGRARVSAEEYAVIWGDGTDWFGSSLDACIGSLPDNDLRTGKPIMALHLPTFAARLVSKLFRPAVRILDAEAK